ncbi:hypothetical protein [Thermococcus peptonophilus]|uniref:CARDB domain-containing protein n=1 Tax=Thermococcus peptonophilus TaxID=53952 RepID=A0A142CWZ8_9EURY|nr:hypothetical protein [Thermococcus peptonophilus]AMQ19300.1 hypothetical protein A0127_09055 [Thermococcus peptonophilus]
MEKKPILGLLILLVILTGVKPVSSEENEGGISLSITVLNNYFTALPGDTLVIPFSIKNTGNTTITNITVYITGPTTGFQYSGKVIRMPLLPNDTYNDTLILKVLNPEPGQYLLRVIARVGNQYFEAPVIVTVKALIDYDLAITAQDRYIYGRPVEVYLTLTSKSNTVISGRVGYYIVGNRTIINQTTITYVKPDSPWEKKLEFKILPLGNYTVVLWANMSGVYKEVSKNFEVYRRALNYSIRFEHGAIRVFVYDRSGRGVPDITVTVNGVELKTDPNGAVTYSVSTPGVYRVTLNLDGKIVSKELVVKSLHIGSIQEGEKLIVQVTDGKNPIPNVTVTVEGPKGKDFGITNSTGFALFNLSKVGYGTLIVKAESASYLPAETIITTVSPPTPTKTSTTPKISNTTTTIPTTTTTQYLPPSSEPAKKSGISAETALILVISGILLAATSYYALAMPTVHEETLDRYYFIKVRAPRLRPLKDYKLERPVKAVEVRTTKGKATLNEDGIVWELDLEPGEEAYLQAILG